MFALFGAQFLANKVIYFLKFNCTENDLAIERRREFRHTYDAETCATGYATLSEAMRLPVNRVLNFFFAVASVVMSYVLFGFDSFVGPWAIVLNVFFNAVGLTEWFEGEHEFEAGAFGALVLLTTIVMCVSFMDAYSWDLRVAFIALAAVIGAWFAAHPLFVRIHKSETWRTVVSPSVSARICDAGLIANEDLGFGLFVAVGCLASV